MKVNKCQLRNVLSVLTALSKQEVTVTSGSSTVQVTMTNFSHQTKVNKKLVTFNKEVAGSSGLYGLNDFFGKLEEKELTSLTVDKQELLGSETSHVELVLSIQTLTLNDQTDKRLMVMLNNGKSRVELNMFDTEYVYRRYVSPDNKSVIVFKNSTRQMLKQFEDYSIESVHMYYDGLPEKKFRDYMYDSATGSGKKIRFADTYKEDTA